METTNYQEARSYFISNATYGWKHIDCFIMSERMISKLFEENSLGRGARILLPQGEMDSFKGEKSAFTIKGYGFIVSSGFSEPYGIDYLVFREIPQGYKKDLMDQNISKEMDLKLKKLRMDDPEL